MDVAEWIIVGILSATLFIFLIVGIILLIKLIKIANSAKRIIDKGHNVVDKAQDIADKADDVVTNAKNWTSVGSLVKTFIKRYNNSKAEKTTKKGE